MSIKKPALDVAKILGLAVVGGASVGIFMGASRPGAFSQIAATAHELAASHGLVRQNAPQSGDYWSGCNDARAAGVTPLYAGEPGYREDMDGDGDGIACEPYRSR